MRAIGNYSDENGVRVGSVTMAWFGIITTDKMISKDLVIITNTAITRLSTCIMPNPNAAFILVSITSPVNGPKQIIFLVF